MGFTENEWNEIKKFKNYRNKGQHENIDVTKAYNIINNYIPDNWNKDLKEGLRKIISKCE